MNLVLLCNPPKWDEPGYIRFTTEQGGLALIVHAAGVESVWLELTDSQLRTWLFGPEEETQLDGWLGAYQAWLHQRNAITQQAWFDQIETTTCHLWDAIMGPVAAALHGLTVPPQTVTLIPTGLLALLPLHAAWTVAVGHRPRSAGFSFATTSSTTLPCATHRRHSPYATPRNGLLQ